MRIGCSSPVFFPSFTSQYNAGIPQAHRLPGEFCHWPCG
jgi:hypothetical protein